MSNRNPLLALQVALVARLRETPTIVALVGTRIYDRWPTEPVYPAIAIGVGDQHVPKDEDDVCGEGSDNYLNVRVFSANEAVTPGMVVPKELSGLVMDALLTGWAPVLDGHSFGRTTLQSLQTFRDDGLTSRVEMTFLVETWYQIA